MVRYADPSGQRLNNQLIHSGFTFDLAGINACSDYKKSEKRNRELTQKFRIKCVNILKRINDGKKSNLDGKELIQWNERYTYYLRLINQAHLSQLEVVLERYSNSKINPDKSFLTNIKNL